MELMLVDGTLELVFVFNDNFSTSIATAHRSLFSGGTLVFIDPAASRAFSTEEIFTSVTEITDVYEIESDVSTECSFTLVSVESLLQESSSTRVSGKVEGSVETGIRSFDISTEGQEALEDIIESTGSCLMHRSVSMHVLPSGRHVTGSSEQDPNNFAVSLETGPM